MNRKFNIRKSKASDVLHLGVNLRQADRDEIKAGGSGMSGYQALHECFIKSKNTGCFTAADSATDKPLAMFGVASNPELKGVGYIWLLGSEELTDEYRIQFIQECRGFVDKLMADYEMLCNFVWEQNTVHIRWLKWCGFNLRPKNGLEPPGFIFFYKGKNTLT